MNATGAISRHKAHRNELQPLISSIKAINVQTNCNAIAPKKRSKKLNTSTLKPNYKIVNLDKPRQLLKFDAVKA